MPINGRVRNFAKATNAVAEDPPAVAEAPPADAEDPPAVAEDPPVVAEDPPTVAEDPPAVAEAPPAVQVDEWIIADGRPVRATYCRCRKAKESCADDMSMVQCSNDECRNMLGEHNANWFHYACVNFNPDADTDFYCSDNCRKKKRKNR